MKESSHTRRMHSLQRIPPLHKATLYVSFCAIQLHALATQRWRSIAHTIANWPCGLMDKALVFGTKDCRFESCQGHCHGLEGWCSVITSNVSYSPCMSCSFNFRLPSRGESGWCSDMTSTHGAWRHAGVRFLLSGAFHVRPRRLSHGAAFAPC